MAAAIVMPELLMKIYTSEPDVITEGVKYLRIVCFAYVLMAVSMVYLNGGIHRSSQSPHQFVQHYGKGKNQEVFQQYLIHV